ncbi:MAG: YHYH protein [Saprospiraceae bacterium]|nr:YHYH protein [Saprospiraceae bacterium]
MHSPIIGFAFDGFPIYGAYAYSNPNGTGSIKRMQSSYQKRKISSRTILPNGMTASNAGPDVSSRYPIGYYIQDFIYSPNSGDLDEHNGRFCITPDYPNGQYCYFVTLDSQLVAEYPYLIGPSYYGTIQAGNTGPGSGHNSINEPVTTYVGTLGNQEIDYKIKFHIFPNPSSEYIHIELEKDLPNNLQFEIIDQLGSVIYVQHNLQPTITYSIDLSTFPKGLYYTLLKSDKNMLAKKLMIE